ncbi:MAG: hypothetical protein K9M17_05630 [Mariprofundaceae bacterium]|nr:hypothetical protein [Mariprofundaceae bacterium]
MAQGTSSEDAKKLMETVSFELDTDLRLHPQKLELGRAELLTDALTMPFMDIEQRLNQFVVSASDGEKLALQKSMKAYLAKLNSNPLIPLKFRLKVLSNFERELELFDSEMTAAVLNAHKIGVDLVQKAARDEPGYYRVLVDMVSNALELAVKMLRIGFEKHRTPAVLTIRQAFDLMRLGLSVIPALPEGTASERERLQKAVSNHELLRMLDFYGKSDTEQKMVWRELQHHVGTLEPMLLRKADAAPKLAGETYMVTSLIRPNDCAKIVSTLPDRSLADLIIIPMDKFIDRMVTAINRVESVLKTSNTQTGELFTEEALHTTIIGGNAILKTMREQPRNNERQDSSGVRLVLEWDSRKAFREAYSSVVLNDYEYAPSRGANRAAWAASNISRQGVGLEKIGEEKFHLSVGAMIGLNWIPHNNQPMLGTIRWIKEPKQGELKMGIKFLQQELKLYKGTLLGRKSDDDINQSRSWPVLIKPGNPYHTAIFPDSKVHKNMTFMLSDEGKGAYFKVAKVMKTGPNFSFCKIAAAEALKETEKLDFNDLD